MGRLAAYMALSALVALCALCAPAAQAVEVGECKPVSAHNGAFKDDACLKASARGSYQWRELASPENRYTDGHPEILDEPQLIAGEGLELRCKANVTVGEITGWSTNTQFQEDRYCELRSPFKAECGNVQSNQIDTAPEEGAFSEGPAGEVLDRFAMLSASFECGGVPATLEGPWEGTVENRRPKAITNKAINLYDLYAGAGKGAQELTLTLGMASYAVTLTGEQEDTFGLRRVVIRTGGEGS